MGGGGGGGCVCKKTSLTSCGVTNQTARKGLRWRGVGVGGARRDITDQLKSHKPKGVGDREGVQHDISLIS